MSTKKVRIYMSEFSQIGGSAIFCEIEGLEEMGSVMVCSIWGDTISIYPSIFSQNAVINSKDIDLIDARCKEINGFGVKDRILTVCNRIARLNPTLIEILQETGSKEISFSVDMGSL